MFILPILGGMPDMSRVTKGSPVKWMDDAEYYGGMVDRIREILRYKHLDSFQKEIRIKQLLGED